MRQDQAAYGGALRAALTHRPIACLGLGPSLAGPGSIFSGGELRSVSPERSLNGSLMPRLGRLLGNADRPLKTPPRGMRSAPVGRPAADGPYCGRGTSLEHSGPAAKASSPCWT